MHRASASVHASPSLAVLGPRWTPRTAISLSQSRRRCGEPRELICKARHARASQARQARVFLALATAQGNGRTVNSFERNGEFANRKLFPVHCTNPIITIMADTATQKRAPAQFKQPSRKGKKAWRKNVDVTQIQSGLEEVRGEIIQGYVGPQALRALTGHVVANTHS